MGCTDNVCGTGGWTGPQPGDPDNTSVLSATAVFGGIAVSWTFPGLNPHAVAHTRLYRGIAADFAAATLLAIVDGSQYYDKLDNGTRYYYWIQIVSVHGTVGDAIGPASAVATPLVADLLAQLSGQIDAGVLAQSLKTEIDRITLLDTGLAQEITNRVSSNTTLAAALAAVQTEVGQTATLVQQEVTARTEGDTALVNQVNVLAASSSGNAAAIVEEQNLRVRGDEALADKIEIIQATDTATFRQATPPDPALVAIQENDLWIDTTPPAEGALPNYPVYQWVGGGWIPVKGNTLAGTFASLEAEKLARVNQAGAIAQSVESLAVTTSRKAQVFFQSSAPAATAQGDLWIDTDDNNRLYMWDAVGQTWIDGADSRIGVALGRNQVFRQASPPGASSVGDLWFDSDDDDKLYRWTGSAWEVTNLFTSVQVSAAISDNNTTMLGYCSIGGVPNSAYENAAACAAAGGTWYGGQPLADAVKTVQVTDGLSSGTIEQRMTAYRGKLDALGALYTVKVQVNGLVGGFGVYNDGTEVQAGFDVDTFWVGRTGPDKVKPFIIQDGVVYISNAMIHQLTADKIDSRGLTIKDAAGNILFGSVNPLDWSRVGGSNRPADNATVGAPDGTLVGGVAAATVASAATNFNASNDRNAAAVTAPTIALDGTAVDHTLQADGSADISFEWSWAGTAGDIDGFFVFVRQSASSDAYTFGTATGEETVFVVPGNKRAFILFGTAADRYYTFGVQAYRSVDKDINATGVIASTLVKASGAGEDPYRPSSTVAYTGNVTGTINGTSAAALVSTANTALANANAAQGTANAATTLLADIASDAKLTPVEKQQVLLEWGGLDGEKGGIDAQADSYGITTEKAAYGTAHASLLAYLGPLVADLTVTSDIVGSTFRDHFTTLYSARQALLNKIAEIAGTQATWANVSGTGKPADNATVGAPAGTYVGGTLAQSVETNAANGQSAYTSVNDATNGLATKLASNARSILSGNGGVVAGDLVWDSAGNRTSGKGVALTAKGLLGHNGTATSFTLDATTGDATFGGTLTAANIVSTAHIVNNAVTQMVTGTGTTSVGLTLTTTGGPVQLLAMATSTMVGGVPSVNLYRGGTLLATYTNTFGSNSETSTQCTFPVLHVDQPVAGTYTYTINQLTPGVSPTLSASAFEAKR